MLETKIAVAGSQMPMLGCGTVKGYTIPCCSGASKPISKGKYKKMAQKARREQNRK